MSDSRIVEERPCEHGNYPFECDQRGAAADGFLGCRGGSRIVLEEVEPDYEAALREYLWIRWASYGMGPYAEELADVVLENGGKIPRISNFEEAKRIVDAALAGARLVREAGE